MLVNYEKQNGAYSGYAQLPLTSRPLDLLYFIFFAVHLPASLIVDLQYLYPPQFTPSILRSLLNFYIDLSRDPLIGGISGAFGPSAHLAWFKSFIVLEAIFQIPVFVLGLRALYKSSRKIYPLLALYGASSATTTLACLATVLAAPRMYPHALYAPKILAPGVTTEQRLLLLSSYVPFFIVPLIMAVDMAMRVSDLVRKGIQAEEDRKWQ